MRSFKKTIILIMVSIMAIGLVGCGEKGNKEYKELINQEKAIRGFFEIFSTRQKELVGKDGIINLTDPDIKEKYLSMLDELNMALDYELPVIEEELLDKNSKLNTLYESVKSQKYNLKQFFDLYAKEIRKTQFSIKKPAEFLEDYKKEYERSTKKN